MANTSATGGPLLPVDLTPPLEGRALNDFIQGWLAGVSGLPGTHVIPAFQPEPPVVPQAGTAWMAFRFHERKSDTFPFVGHIGDGDGTDQMQRHEEIAVLCSFYDLGTNGQADFYAAQLRDGFIIPQNLEPLLLQRFAFVASGNLLPVPSLLKQRWLYRVDLPFAIRRQIVRTYAVENVLGLTGEVITDSGLTGSLK